MLPAAAAGQREITADDLQRIHRQADMTKLAGDVAAAGDGSALFDDDSSADAGTEDQPHHQRILTELIIPGFGERKAVGVVI